MACYTLEALATAAGETPNGEWPWPHLLDTLVGARKPQDTLTVRTLLGPNTEGLWPTPVTHDQATNYAQGGMSLGYAARLPEKFPTPRAEDSESTGAHRGVPGTLTSYTRLRPSAESFPTPTVYDATGHGAPRSEQKEGSRHAVSLHHLVATWPTPTVADASGGPGRAENREGGDNLRTAVSQWPTPRARDWKGADPTRDENRSGHRHSGDDLSTAVEKKRTWPTPMAGPIHVQDGGGHGGVALAEEATRAEFGSPTASMKIRSSDFGDGRSPNPAEVAYQESGQRGQLNPDWVEWLLGWPIGWTSTEPLSSEAVSTWRTQTENATWWDAEPEGVPRIALGVSNRVSRLKAIGNGQVSLCAAWATLALFEMSRQVADAIDLNVQGPIEVDFLDFVDGL